MIIIKLQGGLGNQMFQYAFGRRLAQKYNAELRFDLSLLLDRSIKHPRHVNRDLDLDIFGLALPLATQKNIRTLKDRVGVKSANKVINRIIGLKSTYIREPRYRFTEAVINCGPNAYLEGFWQSEKYFKPIEQTIRELFVVKDELEPAAEQLAAQIIAENAVCVNVRRGDFVTNPFHVVLPPEFYHNAEKILLDKTENPRLYIFSDDLAWCRQNLHFQSPVTFVTHQYAGKKFQDYFRLMSYCKSFIIPNSTFAWWAAYLSKSESKIVVTTPKWYNDDAWGTNDLLLTDWITINE
jgi:hypothetical protein